MRKLIIFLLPVTLFLTGCSLYHVNSEDISTEYHPSKNSPLEIVYLEEVTKPHEVIGYVTVNAERRQRIGEVIEKMKREAAILGGDAITNIKSNATGQWLQLPAQELIGNGYVRADFTATTVVFK